MTPIINPAALSNESKYCNDQVGQTKSSFDSSKTTTTTTTTSSSSSGRGGATNKRPTSDSLISPHWPTGCLVSSQVGWENYNDDDTKKNKKKKKRKRLIGFRAPKQSSIKRRRPFDGSRWLNNEQKNVTTTTTTASQRIVTTSNKKTGQRFTGVGLKKCVIINLSASKRVAAAAGSMLLLANIIVLVLLANSHIQLCLATNESVAPPRPLISASRRAPTGPGAGQRRPESSSSMFADIEDLADSSIKTRLGSVQAPPDDGSSQIEHLGDSPNDFNRLIDRLLLSSHNNNNQQQQQQQQHSNWNLNLNHFNQHQQVQLSQAPNGTSSSSSSSSSSDLGAPVSADANNKTTMRFFRNNKTFASIVYTNNEQHQATSSTKRLINCHLVDLEIHASDTALYEAKYSLKTIDIEFKDMMQLIEACTNIARLKRRPYDAHLHQFHHQNQANGSSHLGQHRPTGPQPLVVVSRPQPAASSHQQQQQSFQNENDNHPEQVNNNNNNDDDHKNNDDDNDGASKLALPASLPPKSIHSRHMRQYHRLGKRQQKHPPQPPPPQPNNKSNNSNRNRLFSKALERVGDTLSKKLVLGEVVVPPEALNGSLSGRPSGGLKEAIQEITSYDSSDLSAVWRGILPGTNWCGMGDRASSYNDLGFESDIDICCRAHDFCPVRLAAFSSGYGLFNWSFYTRSHCWCDQNFLDCLKQAESPLSSVVMKFYFSIMKTTCLNDNDAKFAIRRPGGGNSSKSSAAAAAAAGALDAAGQRQQHQLSRSFQQQYEAYIKQHSNGPLIPALRQSQMVQAQFENNNNNNQRSYNGYTWPARNGGQQQHYFTQQQQ